MHEFQMKWWGWGNSQTRVNLNERPGVAQYIKKKLGVEIQNKTPSFNLEQIQLPTPKISQEALSQLKALLGDRCKDNHNERVLHSYGKSYKDLIRIRSLKIEKAPDVVLYPLSEEEIKKIFSICTQFKGALIPFGGGSSVVSSLDSDCGSQSWIASLDLTGFNRVIDLDPISQTATIEAGIFGPELEKQLQSKGFTLGHFPQSFEFSTLGGWIAARSSGQNSIYYGGIDKLVVSLKVLTPAGTISTLKSPRESCGPDIKQMLLGSEGILGVIISATVRVTPLPQEKHYFALGFKKFSEAMQASRALAQSGLPLAMIRVSDEDESEAMLSMGSSHSIGLKKLANEAIKIFLQKKGFYPPHLSLVMIGLEGSAEKNKILKQDILKKLGEFDFLNLGTKSGQKWLKDRFFHPYLRDEFMDNNLFVDTLETSTTWSNLARLYQGVRESILKIGERERRTILVYTHISHLYKEGASLYFTILTTQNTSNLLEQWLEIKSAANDAIVKAGGSISHHHGIGIDHKKHNWWGPTEKQMIFALKNAVDPHGLLNPGKVIE